MGTSGPNISLTDSERAGLVRWSRLPSTPQAVVLRCQMVLACSRGLSDSAVAREFGVTPQAVSKWRRRFREGRLAALKDRPRSGAPRSITDEQVRTVLEATRTEPPPNGSSWSKRDMAARAGISPSSVLRIWRRLGVAAADRNGIERARAEEPWSALYVAPPETILVLAVDGSTGPEEDACSAVPARSQGYDAVLRRQLATALSRRVSSDAAGELLGFLRSLEHRMLGELEVHLICHGHGTRKMEAIRRWQEDHASLHLHFTPSKEFWLSLVERYFAPLCLASGETPLSVLARTLRRWTDGRWGRQPATWFHP